MKTKSIAYLGGLLIPLATFSQNAPKVMIVEEDTSYCWTQTQVKQWLIPELLQKDACLEELNLLKGTAVRLSDLNTSCEKDKFILEGQKKVIALELQQVTNERNTALTKINKKEFWDKVQNTTIAVLTITTLIFYFL